MDLSREEYRRKTLPSELFRLGKSCGALLQLYRNDREVIVIPRNDLKVYFSDPKYLPDDGCEDSGRSHHLTVHSKTSLIDMVPLCSGKTCMEGCGCRCSRDLGYTHDDIGEFLINMGEGHEVYQCYTSHKSPEIVEQLPEESPWSNFVAKIKSVFQ